MTRTTYERDEELGRALRELPTPEHRPGFDNLLGRRLSEERRRRELARRRRWLARIAAVAAVVGVAVGFGVSRHGGPEVAQAADVQARLRATLGALANVQGRLVELSRNPLTGAQVTHSWSFALTSTGDVRVDELDGPGRESYDAATGVERALNTSASMGTGLFASVRSGLAPGPPDAGPSDSILQRDLGSVVRALLAVQEAQVREIRYEGREAWQVELAVQPNGIYADADHLSVTVDEATGLPVRVVETLRGERRRVSRIERLTLDTPLPRGAFDVHFPHGVEVARTDAGFHRVSLAEAAAAVGYTPLVPGSVPAGFTLSEVAVAKQAAPTGTEAGNPESEDVISLAYRRGFDKVLVTTRRAGVGRWSDPLATGEGFVDDPEDVRVESGFLAGADVHLLVSPRAVPHVWTIAHGLVITVSGDVDRAELLRIAGSLERAR